MGDSQESSRCVASRIRFGRTGDPADIDDAVQAGRLAVAATPPGDPDRPEHLSDLGVALWTRFPLSGNPDDLDEAVQDTREAVATAPADHPNRGKYLSNLGITLLARFGQNGDLTSLDEAAQTLRQAVALTPPGHANHGKYLFNLGLVLSSLAGALEERFERSGDTDDLDKAVEIRREAVAATPAGSELRPGALTNLGVVLQIRFERSGDIDDIDEAVETGRQCVAAAPADHPDRCELLSNLGNALWMRFERSGNLEDLDEAVETGRQAVNCIPDGHPNGPGVLCNLSIALMKRFERTGDLADIDEAVQTERLAVATTPDGHPALTSYLANLCGSLIARHDRSADPADIEDAVAAGQRAAAAMPADYPERADVLSNLSIALRLRFGHGSDLADIDDAITAARESVTVTPAGHPSLPGYLSMLGAALWNRFGRGADPADINEAIEAERLAVASTPAGHPDQTLYLDNLGIALQIRLAHSGSAADAADALAAFKDAADVEAGVPSMRIKAARAGAALAESMGNLAEAARLLETCVLLLPETTPRQLDRRDQQHALANLAGLPGQAAALALADRTGGSAQDRAIRALRLLEAGRAVLQSQALDTRSDITDLRNQRPDLAEEFVRLRDQLDLPPGTRAPTLDSAPDRHRLAAEFTALLKRIRALAGFGTFLLPPSTEQLLGEAAQGPIVVFTVDSRRSDAILLSGGIISSLPLPGLTADALRRHILSFQRALATARDPEADREQGRAAQGALHQTLEWLWDNAAGPVLDTLRFRDTPAPGQPYPRVWWVPGGLLGLLPVHAAGYHRETPRHTVMDRVVSSYTPTIRALRHARERRPAPPEFARSLIVAMPTTPGAAPLSNVAAEAAMLRARLPRPELLSNPTRASVLDHLTRCSIAHFACHGHSDATDPSLSRLLLHDQAEPLTVASLAPVNLSQAELAYLSACETALTSTTDLLDEAIHLTSAFQLAGFPNVIGTLWEVDDGIAVRIADAFYTSLDIGAAAYSLHQAVRAERDRLFRTPSLWAAYLHAGA